MASRNHAVSYGLVATETEPSTGFTGTVGGQSRASIPLGDVAYQIDIAFDGTDVATIDLDNGVTSGAVVGARATGAITFSAAPTASDTITVNSIVYTFLATAVLATDIEIGATATICANNAAVAVSSNDPAVTASNLLGVLNITAAEFGEYGNAITLDESGANTTKSAAFLTGGVDRVIITGGGTDALGNAIPSCTAIHGIVVTCTSGSVTAAVSTIVKDTVSVSNGFQLWSIPGRTDLIGNNLTITSNAVNTTARVTIRARD